MSDSQPEQWRLNVAAIILDEADNVLLGSTPGKSPYWHFPQGGVGKNESFREAVLREVWEEVGIAPESCTILASYGGLRYEYRHKNKKSERWQGQEQTYFLIRCRGVQPADPDSAQSEEFAALRWLPWRELTADLFVPFKRDAIVHALDAFFPRGCSSLDDLAARLSPTRYTYDAARPLSAYPVADKALFGGGKDEMLAQMEDLALRINSAQRRLNHGRLVVQLVGLPGSGLTNCLRRLARSMDPLYTHAVQPASAEASVVLPGAGECTLLNVTPYASALEQPPAQATAVARAAAEREQQWVEQGVCVLKVFLHVSHAEHEDRADAPMSAASWQAALEQAQTILGASASPSSPWYIIPSDKRWYRDFVVASLVAETLEKMR